MKRWVLLGLVLAGCSTSAPTVGPSSTEASTTVVTPAPVAAVEVRLSPTEALAARGAEVQVGQLVRLSESTPTGRLVLPADRSVILDVTYVVAGIPVEPSWSQEVTADQSGTSVLVVEQPWRMTVDIDQPVVLAWQAGGTTESYLEQLAAAPGVTVTSPRWWSLDAAGALVGEADHEFVAEAQAMGIEVWPYITNGFETARTRLAIGDAPGRRQLASQLSEAAAAAGVAGINVDFEAFSAHLRDDFTAFVAELSDLVHAWGGSVSVDITAGVVPAAWVNAHRYDRRGLAEAADYLALMAYDEHNRNHPSGPTASLSWTEDSLYWLFRHADPHEILLGIPLYGRIWDPEELNKPTTATIGAVAELAATNPRESDPAFGVDRVELPDGRYLWAEDYETLAARIELARTAGVAGTAAWRLGFDTPEVWAIVTP